MATSDNLPTKAENLQALMVVHPEVSTAAIRDNQEMFPRLKNVDAPVAKKALQVHILRAYNMKKQPISTDELLAMTNMVYELLMSDTVFYLRSITFEEIGRAINRGILKGELYEMSAADFAHVIADYFSTVTMKQQQYYQ